MFVTNQCVKQWFDNNNYTVFRVLLGEKECFPWAMMCFACSGSVISQDIKNSTLKQMKKDCEKQRILS